jgi:hypothetical protein
MKFRAFVLFGFRTDYDYWYFAVNFNDISVVIFSIWCKPVHPVKTTNLSHLTDKFDHICSAENIL